MGSFLPFLTVVLGGICGIYTLIVNIFRYTTYEYKSSLDSLKEISQGLFYGWMSWNLSTQPV
jgi:hypothetical protein